MSEVLGVSQVMVNLSRFKANVIKEITDGCEAVQQQVITDAKALVPVVTGNLQGSIQPGGIVIEDDQVSAVIVANAEYASYVEGVPDAEGRMGRGRKTPFLGPALHNNQPTFVRAMAAAAQRAQAS